MSGSIHDVYRSKFFNTRDVPLTGLEVRIKKAAVGGIKQNDGTIKRNVVLLCINNSTGEALRPMALNKTNAEALELMFGTDQYAEWKEQVFKLKRETIVAFNKRVVSYRVDVPPELLPIEGEEEQPAEAVGEIPGIELEDEFPS